MVHRTLNHRDVRLSEIQNQMLFGLSHTVNATLSDDLTFNSRFGVFRNNESLLSERKFIPLSKFFKWEIFSYTHEQHRGRESVECIATRYVMDGSEFKTLSEVEVVSSLQLSKPALRITHHPVNGSIWFSRGVKRRG